MKAGNQILTDNITLPGNGPLASFTPLTGRYPHSPTIGIRRLQPSLLLNVSACVLTGSTYLLHAIVADGW